MCVLFAMRYFVLLLENRKLCLGRMCGSVPCSVCVVVCPVVLHCWVGVDYGPKRDDVCGIIKVIIKFDLNACFQLLIELLVDS